MQTSPVRPFLLRDEPFPSIEETLDRARLLVSARTGLIRSVEFQELAPDDPFVHVAESYPADVRMLTGQPALNRGMATSVDPNRAVLKAVGETIERYCAAIYDPACLRFATYAELGDDAVNPAEFALFSHSQYLQAGFTYTRPQATTPSRWVPAYSLISARPKYVPAAFVYVPYSYEAPAEPYLCDLISTGLACSTNLSAALYKGVMEAVERDAFMIVWQNQLRAPAIDLQSVSDPFAARLLMAIESLPIHCHAFLITLDIPVPVILVILTSASGRPPYTVMGMGTDLDPNRALVLALEEACLGFWGMRRLAASDPLRYQHYSDYRNVTELNMHGLAHAVDPELRPALHFLLAQQPTLAMEQIGNLSASSMVTNLNTICERFDHLGLDLLVVDLTTPDISEAGFNVARAIVPGLQPLDINHARQHLGGKRLYEVPYKLGLVPKPSNEQSLNPYPHPFP